MNRVNTLRSLDLRWEDRGSRLPLILILAAYAVLALAYAWATPPLEASDELWHFGLIQHLAETGELPVQAPGVETPWEQEGSQPPLYYFIAALLVQPLDRSDFDAVRQPNPHAYAGVPGAVGNKNLVLHDTPHPPLQGTALAVYAIRLFSMALGAVTVSAVYAAARVLAEGLPGAFPRQRAMLPLLAAGLTAFNPMFLFISASANNDTLVTALNSLIVWQTLLLLRDGFTPRRSVGIALLVALASLSKLSALALLPALGLAALWTAYRRRDGRGLLFFGVCVAGVWALLAGWWYLRNLTLYGELFGTGTMAAVAGVRETPFTLQTLLDEFQGFRFTYWGVFGGVNILTFRWFYDVMDIITLLGLVGLALHLWRARSDHAYTGRVLLLGLIVLTGVGGVIAWTAQTYASQGRLLFPFVAAASPLLALGLAELTARVSRNAGQATAAVGVSAFALFALIVPFASIAPQYAPPAPLAALPESARPVYARFGDAALIGYETPDRRYAPGDAVPITVYWQVLAPAERDLSLYLHAVLADGSVIGKVDSYPGGGRLRTTTWQPGAIYADTYAIPLDATAEGASTLRVSVGWWHYPTESYIAAVREDGQPITAVMLDAGAFVGRTGAPLPEDLTAVENARFGGVIALAGYRWEERYPPNRSLVLYWQATGTPAANYTVFAQVLDAANRVIGQGDAPPDLPTRYWQPGEHYTTVHILGYPEPAPEGRYRLVIGWYDPVSGARLDAGTPDGAVLVGEISVP